tara:strand:+ start:533 stop:1624 length:1092 start_codon:yes stop_codon:yes gene_type:complete
MFSDIFNNKSILVTGHTGFKGSWLCAWLAQLGGKVIGISDRVPTKPSHYELIKKNIDNEYRIDIRDSDSMFDIINTIKPHFIFHLAAQPIVLESYNDPLKTFMTNTIGTANVLEAIRKTNHECTVIMITSDKCYDNEERTYGYSENDRLGGKDPYSGSKGAAELVIKSYFQSFFMLKDSNVRIGIGRAGNVVGGGDWAPNRIVPDCIQSWIEGKKPIIRNPLATRPWQHVLEPLSGYLTLASQLVLNHNLNGEPFNFGPAKNQNHTVKELIDEIIFYWPNSDWLDKSSEKSSHHEAGLLELDCNKSLNILGWQATLDFKEMAEWTSEWYRHFYNDDTNSILNYTNKQIKKYMELAINRNSFKF